MFQVRVPGEGDLVGDECPVCFQPHRIGVRDFAELLDSVQRGGGALGHEAERVIDGGSAPVLNLAPNLGFAGPPVGRTLGNAVFLRQSRMVLPATSARASRSCLLSTTSCSSDIAHHMKG